MEPKVTTFAEFLNAWSTFGTFVIAVASLVVAAIALFRTVRFERPFGSLQLSRLDDTHFLATLTVHNTSRLNIRLEKLTIELPDFRWGLLSDVEVDDGFGNRTLPSAIPNKQENLAASIPGGWQILKAADQIELKFIVFQPAYSRQKQTKVAALYHTMEGKPKWRAVRASAQTRSSF